MKNTLANTGNYILISKEKMIYLSLLALKLLPLSPIKFKTCDYLAFYQLSRSVFVLCNFLTVHDTSCLSSVGGTCVILKQLKKLLMTLFQFSKLYCILWFLSHFLKDVFSPTLTNFFSLISHVMVCQVFQSCAVSFSKMHSISLKK